MSKFGYLFFILFLSSISLQAQQVLINSGVPAELTVCGESQTFKVSISNNTLTTLTNLEATVAFPQGIEFEAGSLVEANINGNYNVVVTNASNPSNITLSMNNLPKDSTIYFYFDAKARFAARAFQQAGNVFRNTITLTHGGGTETHQSDSYNILSAALSITKVLNLVQTAFVGQTFTRKVTIVNGGFGRINSFTLHDVYDPTALLLTATNIGTINASADAITLSGVDFSTVGNGDTWLDLNESITITQTVKVIGCNDTQSELYAAWGCDGQTTLSNKKYPYTTVSLYAPNIKSVASPAFNTCLDVTVPNSQKLVLTNTGTGPANNLVLDIYQTKDDGFDLGVFSKIDATSFKYKIGNNGTLTPITPASTSVTTSTGSYSCLGANAVGRVVLNLPVLQPNETISIFWDTYTCDNVSLCGAVNLIGWDYKVSYTDMCFQSNYNHNNQIGQAPKSKNFSVFTEYPTDLSNNQSGVFSFRFTAASFDMPEGSNPYFLAKFTIPNGLTWSSNAADLKFLGGNSEWTASNITQNGNVLEAKFNLPVPFNLLNSEIQLTLTADCSQGSGTVTVDMNLSYVMNATCPQSSSFPLTCLTSTPVLLHCPGSGCVGMGFSSFSVKRTTFGNPDNDQNGLADASGNLDFSKIKTDRVMVGDEFATTFKGTVHTNATHPNWQFGYAKTQMPQGDTIVPIGVTLEVLDQSTGQTLTCGNVPFTHAVLSNGKREVKFDFSPSVLQSAGCNSFAGFVFENGDQISLVATYKVTGNIGGKIQRQAIQNNEFYLSHVANPTAPADKFQCDTWNGSFTLIGYFWENYNSNNWTLNRCSQNITQYYQFYLGNGPTANNLFPFEYRNWGHVKQVRVEIPNGYTVTGARFYQYRTQYTNYLKFEQTSSLLTPQAVLPGANGRMNYVYNLAQNYSINGGNINPSDDGFYGYCYVTIEAPCTKTQNVNENVEWYYVFNQSTLLGGTPTAEYAPTGAQDKIQYRRGTLNLSTYLQTVDGIEKTVSWDVKVTCNSTGAATNAFLAFNAAHINVLKVIDLSNNQPVYASNGIFRIGNFNTNQVKNFRIVADYNLCTLDQLNVYAGHDCASYPTDFASYGCSYSTFPLYVNPQPSELQVRITGKTAADPCEPRVTIEVDMLSAKLAYVEDVFVQIDVPSTLTIEADSSFVAYPISNGYRKISNPSQTGSTYIFNTGDLNATVANNGLVGVTNTFSNRLKLKFNILMDNNFQAGDHATISVGGYRACGLQLPTTILAYDPNAVFTKADNPTVGLDGDENNWSSAFGDYDNDGFVDLFLVNYETNGKNQLYHNNGDGTFTKVLNVAPALDIASSTCAVWGDYDNDGDLDLFVANNIGYENFLYRNEGGGQFTRILNDPIVNYTGYSHGSSWADFDNDGFLDLFVADYFSTRFNKLYHNNGDGTFEEVTSSPVVTDASFSVSAAWGDYDNDGDQDLFVANTNDQNNFLYQNNGNGTFTKITTGDIVNDGGKSTGASWGDYDNDLDLDLFVANAGNQNNFLYRNNGNGTFTKITTGNIVNDGGNSHGSAWADLDNDGDLDLFVANDNSQNNFLYSNNGDGTFTPIGNIITQDAGKSFGSAWADIDNDFDLDLFVANHDNEQNFLYLNERGKCFSKACISLVGSNTNYNGIGSKIKLLATIDGVSTWQMREVVTLSGGGIGGQNDMRALFGLGDAISIDSIVVEWASGYVQKMGNMPTDTCLTIVEPSGALISGTVFHDENFNCTLDSSENGIPNVALTIQPGNRQVLTDENGFYSLIVAPGNYTILQGENNVWQPNCGSTLNVSVVGFGNQYPNLNFADTALCQRPDLSINLATTALRVGFESVYALTYANNGTKNATNAVLSVDFGDHILPVNASLAWSQKTGTVYTWNLGTVAVGTDFTIYVEDSVQTSAIIGSNITVIANLTATEQDCNAADNLAIDINEAVGAIDPNDLQVFPEGYIPDNQELTYKIRFQNVGNDVVNRVVLKDELPDYLDLATLVRGATSHPYRFFIENERTLVWEFDNINLPDSTTNEAESHGFATFKIRPKVGLPDGTEIPNQAQIFFDNSQVVLTNEVLNIIGQLGEFRAGELAIYPNPMKDFTNIRMIPRRRVGTILPNDEEIETLEIFTLTGQKMVRWNGVGDTFLVLPRGQLQQGYYVVRVVSTKFNIYVGKLLIQ